MTRMRTPSPRMAEKNLLRAAAGDGDSPRGVEGFLVGVLDAVDPSPKARTSAAAGTGRRQRSAEPPADFSLASASAAAAADAASSAGTKPSASSLRQLTAAWEAAADTLRKERDRLLAEREAAREELGDARSSLADAARERDELRARNERLRADSDALARELEEAREAAAAARSERDELWAEREWNEAMARGGGRVDVERDAAEDADDDDDGDGASLVSGATKPAESPQCGVGDLLSALLCRAPSAAALARDCDAHDASVDASWIEDGATTTLADALKAELDALRCQRAALLATEKPLAVAIAELEARLRASERAREEAEAALKALEGRGVVRDVDGEGERLANLARSLETAHMCALARVGEEDVAVREELEALSREMMEKVRGMREEVEAVNERRDEPGAAMDVVRMLAGRGEETLRAKIACVEGDLVLCLSPLS